MKFSKKNILKFLAIIAIPFLVWLGFHREETFVEMNKLIMFKENPEVGNGANETVKAYYEHTAEELYQDKWYLTIRFTFYFFFLSAAILYAFFLKKEVVLYLVYFYIGLFILSGISYGSGFLTGNTGGAYLVARRLMGLLQSPYPFMLIFVLQFFKLGEKMNSAVSKEQK